MLSIFAREPVGEAEIAFCPMIRLMTCTGTGSSTAPRKCNLPPGASSAMMASQSSAALAVMKRKSKLHASACISSGLRLEAARCAPHDFASPAIDGEDETAVPKHTQAFRDI